MVVEFYTSHLLWGKDKGELFRNALEPYQTFTEVSGKKKMDRYIKLSKNTTNLFFCALIRKL